jgi:glutathione synthase/RimK-type ligase-like ATP-grasp enzyme
LILLATCLEQPGLTASDSILARALEARGAEVHALPWDRILSSGGQTVCLRSTWDYHRRIDEFRAWLQAVATGCRLINPLETVLWNADKRYLRELERGGIAIPVTRWFEPAMAPRLGDVLDEEGWDQAVLKPRVSATAFGTHLVAADTELSAADWQPSLRAGGMIQEFVPEVRSAGELSLMYLAGRFSHAVRKRSGSGDYRVQMDAVAERTEASGEVVAFGSRVLRAAGTPWTYARVDVVETRRGPLLMELELIEPELFFTLAPEAADLLAEALIL